MKKIKELISIVNKYKLRNIEVIGNVAKADSKYQEFYDLIHSEKVLSDEDAAAFYGWKPTDKKYRRLKNGLKDRLGSMLFLIDLEHPTFSDYQNKYYKGIKEWTSFLILKGRKANNASLDLIKKSYSELVKIEFTKPLLDYSMFLSKYYGTIEPNPKEYEKYYSLTKKYLRDYNAEVESEIALIRLLRPYTQKKVYNENNATDAADAIKELKRYSGLVDTSQFLVNYYYILLVEKMAIHDYSASIIVCQEAVRLITAKKFFFNNAVLPFYSNMAAALIYLRRYEEAEEIFNESDTYTEEGNASWFNNKALHISLFFHRKEFKNAYTTYSYAKKLKKFRSIPSHQKETWKILEAWIHLSAEKDEFQTPEIEKGTFRVSKFLNSLPIFSNDKSGMNVQIILIQTTFLLIRERYDQIEERIEALKKYANRHLDKEVNYRSNLMIKMVRILAEENFHKSNTIAKTDKLLALMMTKEPNIIDEAHDLELMPYETVWAWILGSCEDEFH